jgi:hypothetical protein
VGVKGAGQKLKGLMWRQRTPRSGDDSTDSDVPGGGLRWWRHRHEGEGTPMAFFGRKWSCERGGIDTAPVALKPRLRERKWCGVRPAVRDMRRERGGGPAARTRVRAGMAAESSTRLVEASGGRESMVRTCTWAAAIRRLVGC